MLDAQDVKFLRMLTYAMIAVDVLQDEDPPDNCLDAAYAQAVHRLISAAARDQAQGTDEDDPEDMVPALSAIGPMLNALVHTGYMRRRVVNPVPGIVYPTLELTERGHKRLGDLRLSQEQEQ